MTKPDFIIMGAMKSATSTLHEQLALQEGIFMTTPKEPNYFSDDTQYVKGAEWYDALFLDANEDDLCGESSTHYTKLPDYPLTVKRMSNRLQSPKLIYVLRHPVDRLVSHYIHQWSQNIMRCDINEAIDQYEELIAYSCYAKQLAPYIQQFGCENILLVCNEAIRENQQSQLQRVADFIDYTGDVVWENDLAAQNISEERVRNFKGYKWLIDSKVMTILRRILVPQWVRNRVKNQLTMKKRPKICESQLEKIITLFDKDLGALGKKIGVELSCDSYKKIVTSQNLNWILGQKGN